MARNPRRLFTLMEVDSAFREGFSDGYRRACGDTFRMHRMGVRHPLNVYGRLTDFWRTELLPWRDDLELSRFPPGMGGCHASHL